MEDYPINAIRSMSNENVEIVYNGNTVYNKEKILKAKLIGLSINEGNIANNSKSIIDTLKLMKLKYFRDGVIDIFKSYIRTQGKLNTGLVGGEGMYIAATIDNRAVSLIDNYNIYMTDIAFFESYISKYINDIRFNFDFKDDYAIFKFKEVLCILPINKNNILKKLIDTGGDFTRYFRMYVVQIPMYSIIHENAAKLDVYNSKDKIGLYDGTKLVKVINLDNTV